MFAVRRATPDDALAILPRTRAFNLDEGITIDETALAASIAHLLRSPELGAIWVVERDGRVIGHAVISYGYDLEFAGRDSFLTELWVDPDARGHGAATALLARIATELRAADIRALHLQVRAENPARRLYERTGFELSPRVTMTKKL